MEEFRQKYIDEVREMLSDMEEDILSLDVANPNKESLQKVFRTMHTIKGTSGMYGFTEIESFTHRLENIYDEIIDNKLQLDEKIIELTLQSGDFIRSYLKTDGTDQNIIDQIKQIFSELETYHSDNLIVEKKISEHSNNEPAQTSTILIDFFPETDLFIRGINALSLLEELNELGKCYFRLITQTIPDIQKIDPTLCQLRWQIALISDAKADDVEDVFLFLPDEYRIISIFNQDLRDIPEVLNHFEEKSSDEFDLSLLEKNAKSAQTITFVTETSVEELPSVTQKNAPETFNEIEKILQEGGNTTIKVSSDKLDELMKIVSQLFTTKAELQLITDQHHEIEALKNVTEKIEKLTNSLRENALNIRLVPVNELVGKFKRLVHDLTQKLNKQLDFVIEGGDTEIDKSIIEQAVGPLMHIIRNAIDHGIETPDERTAKGKPPRGILKFIAFHSGASVFIQVHDDGKGIDHNYIQQLAIEKGLVPPHTQLSRKEAYELIFLPGFSTSVEVSKISGRGVGMDVVKKQIGNLRGEINIDSEIDLGTSITLRLPITLSIIETLHVKVNQFDFLIPLHLVESSYEVSSEHINSLEESHISLDDNLYPFISLEKHFKYNKGKQEIRKLVLVNFNNEKIGFVVDSIVGQYQAVFKPLGELYKYQKDISGASILGDGNIALLLEVNAIIKKALNKV